MFRLFSRSVLFIPFKTAKINPTNANARQTVNRAPLLRLNSTQINTNVSKDVILFKYEDPKFFKYLNIFGVCQFGFWAYLSVFAFSTLKDVPVPKEQDAPFWKKINMGDPKFKITFAFISFLLGYGILISSWMFTLRSVKYLILRKGGKQVSIVSHTPMGENRIMTLDIENVSCKTPRDMAKTILPIKVRNKLFFYMMDMKGEFKNPKLFDVTCGVKRAWNK